MISNGYAFAAADDGKTLAVRVDGTTSATTTTVSVTQTLQAVMANESSDNECTLSSSTVTSNTQSSATIGGKTWDISYDWTDAGAPSTTTGFDATKGKQFGTAKNSLESLEFSTSGFSGTITSITINTSGASSISCTLSVTVGGTTYTIGGEDSVAITASAADYTFEGSSSGTIVVTWTNSSAKAIYLNGFVVSVSTGSHNIANVTGHEAAQKAVVAFAKAMNEAFDETLNCTSGVADAWSTASTAYSSNVANNASLSADEKAYAKNLIKYADAEWTDDTDDDYSYCLERAMATYEACIQKHGQTAFMSDVRPVAAASRIIPLSFVSGNGNTVAIIVIISMISVTAIGGYFFLRKRKEQ